MKLLTTILFLTCILDLPVHKENDLSRELLRGRVKSCTVIWYTISTRGSEQKRMFVKKLKTEYNIAGFKTKVTNIDEWDRDKKSYEYNYNAKGELINNLPYKSKVVKVAKDGSRVETINSSGLITIKKYGADKFLKERITTDEDGKVLSSSLISNNNRGYIIKSEDFGPDGKLSQTLLYNRDDYDNLIGFLGYNSSNIQTSKTIYTYASGNGPLLEQNIYLPQYGSNLQFFESTKYSNSDQNKNWLQSIKKQSGEPPFLTIRQIEYYPD